MQRTGYGCRGRVRSAEDGLVISVHGSGCAVAFNKATAYSVPIIVTHYLGRREHPGVSEQHHGQVVRVGETTRETKL